MADLSSRARFSSESFERLGLHQKKFPLTQLAERDEASWICAFVKHTRPPEQLQF